MIIKFCVSTISFKIKNRPCISVAPKHGPRHFEKPTDRAVNSSSENFKKCNTLGHMLWFININKNLAPVWSLRPPMDSLIYFEIHHEYVTYQIWSKIYSTKHIPNKENQLFSSESTFSGFLKFLTLAKRDFLLFVLDKATFLDVYLLSGAQLKQVEELRCAQNNRTGDEGSSGPSEPTSFRSTPALPACVSPFDTSAPLRLSSTLYKNH